MSSPKEPSNIKGGIKINYIVFEFIYVIYFIDFPNTPKLSLKTPIIKPSSINIGVYGMENLVLITLKARPHKIPTKIINMGYSTPGISKLSLHKILFIKI